MKTLVNFFKLTASGGFLVLLPILLFILLVLEIFDMVQGLAVPIASLLPQGLIKDPVHPMVLSFLLLAVASLGIGLIMKSNAAISLGSWMEEKTIGRLAIYEFVKSLVSGLLGAEKSKAFKPALMDLPFDHQQFVYLVENLDNGNCIVLCPNAPSGFAGPVKIVPKEMVTILNVSLGDLNLVMTHMGLGAGKLLEKSRNTKRLPHG